MFHAAGTSSGRAELDERPARDYNADFSGKHMRSDKVISDK